MTTLEKFKRNNQAWTKIKCIFIDKDFMEMSGLKIAFPDATVLLCQFHVLKYLREEIACEDYGFTPCQKQQIQGIMNLLVYAKTERERILERSTVHTSHHDHWAWWCIPPALFGFSFGFVWVLATVS